MKLKELLENNISQYPFIHFQDKQYTNIEPGNMQTKFRMAS